MPKVRALTEAARKADARAAEIRRNHDIIREACRRSEYGSLQALAASLGVNYTTLTERLRSGSIKAVDMAQIIRALRLDTDTVLALMGSPDRCQYERRSA